MTMTDIRRGRGQKRLQALKSKSSQLSSMNKMHIFKCMCKMFPVEFYKIPLKIHTKYFTHTLKMHFLFNAEI